MDLVSCISRETPFLFLPGEGFFAGLAMCPGLTYCETMGHFLMLLGPDIRGISVTQFTSVRHIAMLVSFAIVVCYSWY